MTDGEDEKRKSYILIRFADVGSVIVDVQFENVTSLQILALAHYFEVRGKSQLVLEENSRAERERELSLAIPSEKIIVGRK